MCLQESKRGRHAAQPREERQQHRAARVVQGLEHGAGGPADRRVPPRPVRAALRAAARPRGQPGRLERQHGHALRRLARQLRRRLDPPRLEGLRRQQVQQRGLHARDARRPRPGPQLDPRLRRQEALPDGRRQRPGPTGECPPLVRPRSNNCKPIVRRAAGFHFSRSALQ